MNTTERDAIAAKADMIVCGYAFMRTEDAFMHAHASDRRLTEQGSEKMFVKWTEMSNNGFYGEK